MTPDEYRRCSVCRRIIPWWRQPTRNSDPAWQSRSASDARPPWWKPHRSQRLRLPRSADGRRRRRDLSFRLSRGSAVPGIDLACSARPQHPKRRSEQKGAADDGHVPSSTSLHLLGLGLRMSTHRNHPWYGAGTASSELGAAPGYVARGHSRFRPRHCDTPQFMRAEVTLMPIRLQHRWLYPIDWRSCRPRSGSGVPRADVSIAVGRTARRFITSVTAVGGITSATLGGMAKDGLWHACKLQMVP